MVDRNFRKDVEECYAPTFYKYLGYLQAKYEFI